MKPYYDDGKGIVIYHGDCREMIERPTMGELDCLSRILRKATHRTVADALLKGFMWAVWPEWYDRNKWEFYKSKGISI